ncbi:MAG: FAD-binding protein [Acidimicrobiia bacterium]|nr:FAD-binding protein [Acidimicrobiia bacterium]
MTETRRIAALVKQVPKFDRMTLGPDGRLQRDGIELEMNPYCRRAVAQAVEIARAGGGAAETVVLTMGPPSAADCLLEAIACGADRGVLLTDRSLAGSDTLVTARALARLVAAQGPIPLVLVGKNSVDADTGQVGPELARLLGYSFAGPAKELSVDLDAGRFEACCETDAGLRRVRGELPAVVSCAERLCAPAKADPEARGTVDAGLVETVDASVLGPGVWGAEGSPTRVGGTRVVEVNRRREILAGDLTDQVRRVARAIEAAHVRGEPHVSGFARAVTQAPHIHPVTSPTVSGRAVWAVVEGDQPRLCQELAQEASRLAAATGGAACVVSLGRPPGLLPATVRRVVHLDAAPGASDHDFADAMIPRVAAERPWAVLFPSTARGRAVASEVAAALDLGLTGDAVELDIDGDELVAWKPAFGGQLLASIMSCSDVQMTTVRPGVLACDTGGLGPAAHVEVVSVPVGGRVVVLEEEVQDDIELLATALVVIGVGVGVDPGDYGLLEPLRKLLDAELAATRKVTDNGWMPRSRQVGITGRSVAPHVYMSIGASGKYNHTCGLRAADLVIAVNTDASAPVFEHADYGIVADWHDVVPLLEAELRG